MFPSLVPDTRRKGRANDDRLRSRYSDQWLEYFHDVQSENYVGGPGVKPLKLMSWWSY